LVFVVMPETFNEGFHGPGARDIFISGALEAGRAGVANLRAPAPG